MSQDPAQQKRHHFIAGLPRSGSTMLSAIMRQNPKFHAAMSSPIAGLFDGVIGQLSAGTEMAPLVSDTQRARLLRGLFDSYYAEHDAEVIFDTNRAWTAQMPALMHLFPQSRMICCVRNVAWVMDSLERKYRENAFDHTRLFGNHAERSSVYTRLEAVAGPTRLVGYSYNALREACYGEFANRLVIVDYDLMVARPADVLGLLYDFLEEPHFDHDFGAVEYDAPEFDNPMGVRDLHRVHPKVEPRPRKTILPPDLFEKYAGLDFWSGLKNSRAFRIVAEQKNE